MAHDALYERKGYCQGDELMMLNPRIQKLVVEGTYYVISQMEDEEMDTIIYWLPRVESSYHENKCLVVMLGVQTFNVNIWQAFYPYNDHHSLIVWIIKLTPDTIE